MIKNPKMLTDEQLSEAYSNVGFLQEWCKGVSLEMFNRMQVRPEAFKEYGYRMGVGRQGPRKWYDEQDILALFTLHDAADKLVVNKPITPTQAEKVLPKEEYKELEKHILREPGKPAIVREQSNSQNYNTFKDSFID